jgi:SAM-dependent methyltransferase/NAD(P)-dependent dehydrogenase (short-subunit alcohol dehydrogenase family)
LIEIRVEHNFVISAPYHGVVLTSLPSYDSTDPDFLLTEASGQNLPAVVRGETTILEHMTKDDKLNNYYQHALGFHELNELIATTVQQISHRYPNMNICEIGAGTGGSSRRILAKLGTAYSSYTYTDVSSGFFGKAEENFAAYKDRMIYKTLDITVDPTEQGFEEGAYDIVVAANVLHATPDLVATLSNARKLLRPGGSLILMEFIDDSVMRLGVIIGGLPGWWIGRDSGRKYSPCVSLPVWNDIFLKSGFSGVDTSTPVHDPVVTPASIIVTQAIDNDMTMLRNPSASPANATSAKNSQLVILGGNKASTEKVVGELVGKVESHYKTVTQFKSWEDLEMDKISPNSSILNMCDLDGTFWRDITVDRFEKLKTVLMPAANVMWITWGADRDNGDGAMTVGFFRSLRYELPEAQLQILDLEEASKADASFIAERLLRLEVTAQWKKTDSVGRKLWTTEPELRLRNQQVLIPRVLPHMQQNDRYNSAKRAIEKDVDLRECIVSLNWDGAEYSLREEESTTLPFVLDHRRIYVDSSILSSIVTPAGRLYFSLGTDMESGERVLSVSRKNASAILVPKKWSVVVEVGRSIDAQYLSFLSGYLLSQYLSALLPRGGTLVVHEADPGLASMISRRLNSVGCKVLFTTSNTEMVKRNWAVMHPRIPDRQLRNALPTTAAIFLDLSSASSKSDGAKALGNRIGNMLPSLCEKHDASIVIARESTELLGFNDDAIHELLDKANSFAAAQLNGVPDGMPLRMVPVNNVLSNVMPIELMSIVNWHGETSVPVRVEPISNRNDLFRDDKTYWLVGLAGDLGRSICDFMVAHGARYVVLSSRSPKVNEEWIEDHALQCATVAFMKADITKKSDLESVYEQIKRNMPPVAGVTNGSLVLRDRGLINMDLETFHVNTKCKVEGTEYLDEMFPDNTLDWFIAFSSISATVGNMGQMAYTAANMFMKALIAQRRQRGVAGSVIDISQVFGVGYIEREMKLQTQLSREQAIRLMSRSGTLIMSEPDLHQLFAEAVIAGRAGSAADHEIITGIKTITPAESKEALWGDNVRFGHFIQEVGAAKLPSVTKTTIVPVKVQLEASKDAEEMATILKTAFTAKLRASLLMNEEVISDTTPLIDLGVDSLVAVEIRTWFAQEVGADVAVLKILGGLSIQDLVDDTMSKIVANVTKEQTGANSPVDDGGTATSEGSTDFRAD